MKLYKLLIFIIGLSLSSCEYDYEVDLGEFTPNVVVNSIINPDSTVKASLFWSRHTDDTSGYKVVDRFTAILYENNSVIFDGEGIDGALATAIYPKEGAKYRLEIDVPQYGKLSAETSIPLMPTVDLDYTGVIDGTQLGPWGSYYHFTINKISPNSDTRSLMIRVMSISEVMNYDGGHYYANNAFCDQFNALFDISYTDLKGSSIDFEHYIRIPYKNIDQAIPLKFSVSHLIPRKVFIDYDDDGFPIYTQLYETVTEIIAPSNEYDKYYKSAYQQNRYVYIFSDTYSVHSNIENGLGIFAGYSSASITKKIELDE